MFQKSLKRRPKVEYIGEWIIRPLAHLCVFPLAKLGVNPIYLVLFHTLLGIYAGVLIYQNKYIESAVLIFIKTILDAADGQLARATDQVSDLGRYLDSEGDFLVNFSLFIFIGIATQNILLSLVAFSIFTLFLSLDYNFEFAFQKSRLQEFRAKPKLNDENTKSTIFFRKIYEFIFGKQDYFIRKFIYSRFESIFNTYKNNKSKESAFIVYNDELSILILTNLGLAEQMLILIALLLLGIPEVFIYICFIYLLIAIFLQLFREIRLRNFLSEG